MAGYLSCQSSIISILSILTCGQIHARLGEVLYLSADGEGSTEKQLAEALRRFCRSIELCDDYLRGYYGLKLVNMLDQRGTTTC